jgi:hypothetical protein
VWSIFGLFLLPIDGDVDPRVRAIATKLASLFKNDRRLGVSPLITMVSVDQPEPFLVNDIPILGITFVIEAFDR